MKTIKETAQSIKPNETIDYNWNWGNDPRTIIKLMNEMGLGEFTLVGNGKGDFGITKICPTEDNPYPIFYIAPDWEPH